MTGDDDALIKVDDAHVDRSTEPANDQIQLIEVKNLIVSPAPMRRMQLGDVDSLVEMVKDNLEDVKGVFWCEDEISLLMGRGDMTVTFVPEWNQATRMFFDREGARQRYEDEPRVWEGEYSPVVMNKTTLVRYLKAHGDYFGDDVLAAIKNTRVTEHHDEKEISLDEHDDDQVRREEEFIRDTNLPPEFRATMPLFEGYTADLLFEARLTKEKDRYTGAKKGNYKIQLRLINGREAVRGVMREVLGHLPMGVPEYYGRYRIDAGKRGM